MRIVTNASFKRSRQESGFWDSSNGSVAVFRLKEEEYMLEQNESREVVLQRGEKH